MILYDFMLLRIVFGIFFTTGTMERKRMEAAVFWAYLGGFEVSYPGACFLLCFAALIDALVIARITVPIWQRQRAEKNWSHEKCDQSFSWL